MQPTQADLNFAAALKWLGPIEGGYVDDKEDPGGATNRGVTQRTYDAWRHSQGLTSRDVRLITKDEASQIYHLEFWLPMGCGTYPLMPYGLALMCFDTAVQWSVHGATVLIGNALGVSANPTSIRQCILSSKDLPATIEKIYQARRAFRLKRVHARPTQIRFLAGWLNRDAALRDQALKAPAAAPAG